MGITCEIIFGKISSEEIGVTVEGYPRSIIPERDIETEAIPGRNGMLLYDYGTYQNYDQPFTIHWKKEFGDVHIAQWLHKPGYQRLEDSLHPDHFRMAYFSGPADIENRMNVLGRSEILFNCKPQFFRKSGEVEISLTNGQTLINTGQKALPLITVDGNGSGVLTVGDVTVFISEIPNGGVVLDSDIQDAYSVDRLSNYNDLISLSKYDFPSLLNGNTLISWSGGIASVKIIPRWWDLA